MRILLCIIAFMTGMVIDAQNVLTISGKVYTDNSNDWSGVNISRSVPTKLIFKNNSITSVNALGYLLQAGDEIPGAYNNNLDGEIITGNKFIWNGTDLTSITHGIFTGFNINAVIKYNYCDKIPMGIIRKSNGMTDLSGVVAYNIIKNPVAVGMVIKGMNGVKIFNNTFYSTQTKYTAPGQGTARGLIDIYMNKDIVPNGSAAGTKIFNNIFYTKNQIANIVFYDKECLTGFESDYNVFYCEAGDPVFRIGGTTYTFKQWQALGYDIHSKVINPAFKDLINFVPATRLDYGKNLGPEYLNGLSVASVWGTTDPLTTPQNGNWQVGAVVHAEQINQPPSISLSSPSKSTSYVAPATITIDAIAYDPDGEIIKVEFYNGTSKLGESTDSPWSYTWKDVAAGTYTITAVATDNKNFKSSSEATNVTVENLSTQIEPVNSTASKLIKLYPNPNNGRFSVDLLASFNGIEKHLSIIDSTGNTIYFAKVNHDENTIHFDLSEVNPGLYFVKIQSEKKVLTGKFIKN